MPVPPPSIDEGLCREALNRATGAAIHSVANVITCYQAALEVARQNYYDGGFRQTVHDEMVSHADEAEKRLRAFVTRQRLLCVPAGLRIAAE